MLDGGFLHNIIYIFYFLDQAQSNINIVDRKAANQTSASEPPQNTNNGYPWL